ncbi:cyclin-J-like protein isoform X1 [Carassius gibelio]|uniref:cyclin-J-like protein isoform X1 n=1 Tax=Carassius gibelio TaxID=101364 RepID=UPI002278BE0C|nr:cyclin-J-like protein isoform X1 [Carassius gibelio]
MGKMESEGQWWKSQLAADIHQALRIKELKLPTYQAQSPQIGMRRYFADLLAVLSNRYQLCPTARHLAVYLLDLFMDHYDVAVRQLYVIALSCLLLASKFEEKEDRVPKLEQLNTLGFMCSLNLTLNKRDLIKMELLLLETFGWNLCMPTPAHFIDYYLHAAVQEGDLHNGWPLSSMSKTKAFMDKYTHYFLEVSLQDHAFLSFRPSQVAAACIAASRICLQISPSWTTVLHLLTGYSWDHLTQCIQLMLLAHDNDVKEANKSKSSPSSSQSLQPQALIPHSPATPALQRQPISSSQQLLLQASRYPQLPQHSPALSQLHMLADCQVLGPVGSREYLQPHQAGLLSASVPASSFASFPSLASGLRGLPLQGPISMQVSVVPERHCLGLTYGSGYLSSHHSFTAGCFDR